MSSVDRETTTEKVRATKCDYVFYRVVTERNVLIEPVGVFEVMVGQWLFPARALSLCPSVSAR